MEKVDFLNYRALVLEVRQVRSCLIAIERSMGSVSGSRYSHTPGAPPSGVSQVEASVVKFIDARELYEAHLAKIEAQIVAIEQAIQALESPAERLVMRLRYLEGYNWTKVCMRLRPEGYSERQVYRLHGSALLKLREV